MLQEYLDRLQLNSAKTTDSLDDLNSTNQVKDIDMDGKVESLATERDGLAKVVVELEARLKESESRLEESKLRAAKERRPARSLRKS